MAANCQGFHFYFSERANFGLEFRAKLTLWAREAVSKTAVAQQASKEVETSLVSDFSPVFYRYTNVFL